MKNFSLSLVFAFGLAHSLNAFGAPTPPSGKYFDAMVGVAITKWSMSYSLTDSLASATNTASERRYDTSIPAYVAKFADVRLKDLYGFELGANLLFTQISSMFDLSSRSDTNAGEEAARQLLLYASRHVSEHIAIRVETKFRKFEGNATLVNLPYASPVLNSYGADGTYTQQTVGAKTSWNTTMREIAIQGAYSFEKPPERRTTAIWYSLIAGYRNLSYSAPAEISIDNYPSTGSVNTASLVFADLLMVSDFNAHTLEIGTSFLGQLSNGWGVSSLFLMGFGSYNHMNAYFEVPSDFILSFPLQASVFYAGENWQVVLGIDMNWLISIPASGDVALKKTLPVRDQFGSKTITAGRTIHVFSERDEMYWGPFVSFVYTF